MLTASVLVTAWLPRHLAAESGVPEHRNARVLLRNEDVAAAIDDDILDLSDERGRLRSAAVGRFVGDVVRDDARCAEVGDVVHLQARIEIRQVDEVSYRGETL